MISDDHQKCGRPGERKMDPKLYLLFALFSAIVASASHQNLREYLRKLRVARPLKRRVTSQA
jgi:hypothetical protein